MLELRSRDVVRITGETNPGRIVQRGLLTPSIKRSKKRGVGGHVYAVFPDMPLFKLRRDLSELGFGDEVIRPIARAIQKFDALPLLAIRLVLWRDGAGIKAAFFDERRPDYHADYSSVRERILSERTLLQIFGDVCQELMDTLRPGELAELRQSMADFADHIEARGQQKRRLRKPSRQN